VGLLLCCVVLALRAVGYRQLIIILHLELSQALGVL
jgi:hypothetical protein